MVQVKVVGFKQSVLQRVFAKYYWYPLKCSRVLYRSRRPSRTFRPDLQSESWLFPTSEISHGNFLHWRNLSRCDEQNLIELSDTP